MSMKNLVDLVRFELTTSSMPFKKYQSLTGIANENTRVSRGRFGLQWTPRRAFFGCGLRSDSRIPRLDRHRACSYARGCHPL